MQIDFSSLSFKIKKPTTITTTNQSYSPPHNRQIFNNSYTEKLKIKNLIGMQDTQASNYEQQTTNPFRRTFHLFKHVQNQKKICQQESTKFQHMNQCNNNSQIMQGQGNQTVYSLQNFDSFKNYNSKQISQQRQIKYFKPPESQLNQSSFIKIQNDYQNSNQFSLIMDDLNCQIKNSDLIPTSNRRIKTQYDQCKKSKKQSNRIFCLTAQQQSSQSNVQNVKQFYFDLRNQPEIIQPVYQVNKNPNVKTQIKQMIYNFIDQLQIMNQSQIDPQFIEKLQLCLLKMKKIPELPMPKQQTTPDKWMKKDKLKSNKIYTENDTSPSVPSARRNKVLTGRKNKENINISKNLQNQYHKNIFKVQPLPIKTQEDKIKKKWLL